MPDKIACGAEIDCLLTELQVKPVDRLCKGLLVWVWALNKVKNQERHEIQIQFTDLEFVVSTRGNAPRQDGKVQGELKPNLWWPTLHEISKSERLTKPRNLGN